MWRTHSIIGTVVIVFICVVNTIPVMAITVLANLDTVSRNRLPKTARSSHRQHKPLWMDLVGASAPH